MITLYRPKASREADEVQDALEDLVLAHRVVEVDDGKMPEGLSSEGSLPVLVEGEDLYEGDEIEAFLDRRGNRLRISRRMSADACFLDPDDPKQCI